MRFRVLCLALMVLAGPVARAQDAADKPLAATLKRRFTVGGAADADFTPAMLFPQFVTTDDAGHLHVVDRAESRVIEYDAKGARVRTFGRKGRGPGELASPFAIGVGADGSISIMDAGKRALVRFVGDGKILPEIPVQGLGFVWATRLTDEGAPTLSDVYSLATGYIGTVNLGRAKPVAFMSDGALVSLETDSDDAPMLAVYDVSMRRP